MAFDPTMAHAVSNTSASSAEYNKVVDNVTDLNTRVVSNDGRITLLEGASAAVGPWTAPSSFNANWANRSGTFYNLQVRTQPGGNIQILGDVQRVSGVGSNGDTVATLAAGFRPTKDVRIPAVYNNGQVVMVQVASTGVITIFAPTGITHTGVLSINGDFPGPSAGV